MLSCISVNHGLGSCLRNRGSGTYLCISPLLVPFRLLRSHSSTSVSKEARSEEHTSELQSRENLVCRLLLEKKKNMKQIIILTINIILLILFVCFTYYYGIT